MYIRFKERPKGVSGGVPLINEIITPKLTGITATRTFNLKLLVDWIQRTPEAVSLLRKIANDIVNKVEFVGIDKKNPKGGRRSDRKVQEYEQTAKEFFAKNKGRTNLHASVVDWMMTGNNYVWMGIISEDLVKEVVKQYYKRDLMEFKETEFKIKDFLDEDFTKVNAFRYVPSETVEIDYNETEILGYIQYTYSTFRGHKTTYSPYYVNTGFGRRYWKPSEIIHGKFMEMSGKVYGYTPMSALAPVIRTLGLIKDYAGTFFENGGVPDFMFMFESQGFTNQKNIDYLKEQLQKYKSSANKHGNLVGESTGKFQAIKLNDFSKDMEFRQLMIMYAGLIASSFDFPSARMKSIIGSDIKGSTGETDAETDAYERNIISAKEYICDLWNTQLWMPYFNVKMILPHNYRQDEVREAQTLTQNMAALQAMVNNGIIPTDEAIMELLPGWSRDKIKSINIQSQLTQANRPLPNSQVLKGLASQSYQNEKRKQAPVDKNKQMGN
ncbi:MAG: phage portal protein [Candidatus Heimdallarchaeaceae archaeon]